MFGTHLFFDLLAYATAAFTTIWISRRWGAPQPLPQRLRLAYAICLAQGVILGSLLLGTLNLYLSGITDVLGKSILGALLGGIVAAEGFKAWHGLRGSTGAILVPGLALGIAVGRIGCFTAGLEDQTYGTATELPWGVDMGDGVLRHPVALYETATMGVLAVIALQAIRRGSEGWWRNGFYLFALAYATQRFFWEFLKPYAALVGPLNLFHLFCLLLAGYGLYMLKAARQPLTEAHG